METAKLFENGRSQAIRLPKNYRFIGNEVNINKIGDVVMIMPKKSKWSSFAKAIELFSDDFMKDGRTLNIKQKRESL